MSKLKWQCRRGMKELDIVLMRYLEQVYPQATPEQQQAFAHLLACADSDLYLYLLKGENPASIDAAQLAVLEVLRGG